MERPLQLKLNTIYKDREVTIILYRTKDKETVEVIDAIDKHMILLSPEERQEVKDLMNRSAQSLNLHSQRK